jgi:GNAT superfamily N-acetyltransferase
MTAVNMSDEITVMLRRLLAQFLKRKQAFSFLNTSTAHKTLSAATTTALKRKLAAKLATALPAEFLSEKETVRVCQLHEYKAIAYSLALSFEDDPVALYFTNTSDTAHWTESQKWNLHLTIMEAVVYSHLLDGMVTTIGDDYGCVALWMPPGANGDSFSTLLRSGMWKLQFLMSREGRERWFKYFMPTLHDIKHETLGARDDDSWYLVYLGTRPEARRKGYARAVIEDVTRKADVEGRPVYLESSKAMNVPIYEKFGFEKRTRMEMPETDGTTIPLEIMVREPNAKSSF